MDILVEYEEFTLPFQLGLDYADQVVVLEPVHQLDHLLQHLELFWGGEGDGLPNQHGLAVVGQLLELPEGVVVFHGDNTVGHGIP